ncbi:uncharacterized protein LOC119995554 [Tripterygium wilfordii]|uniref:uncharacterized protein LOC119995554 n=1 Tax=Tripterygium wilfordii TaxID=458696 RepID=UPI0018F7F6FC|nr:uncharacterized protein LOC119995554 [Tripterygium wilfordii]
MRHCGSVPCHRVINRNWEEGHQRLWYDYFTEVPVFPPHLFRRCFWMNQHLFCRIVYDVVACNDYFRQKRDALGILGLSSLQKVTVAIQMLAYGQPVDSVDEYIRIGESIVIQCLRHFVATVVDVYADHYLRAPNSNDIARLLSFGEQEMYTRHACEPTIILKVVASSDLLIWHAFFGMLSSINDINVLDRSPLFDALSQSCTPAVNYVINGHEYNMGYYLVDGIYLGYFCYGHRF